MPRHSLLVRQSFQPWCPNSKWYVCTSGTKFVGCCNNEPCTLGCKDGNIEPASFNPSFYGQFPDLSCETGSRFYTCQAPSPTYPFWGCCKINPCNGGCSGNLTPASLTGNQALDCQYNAGGCDATSSSSTSSAAASTSISTTSLSTSSTSSSTSTSSVSTSNAPSSQPSAAISPTTVSHHSSTGAIAGGAVGGVAGLALVLLLIFYCYRHASRSRKKRNNEVDAQLQSRQPSALPAIPPLTPESKHPYQGMPIPHCTSQQTQLNTP
jgi:hypothetical protein